MAEADNNTRRADEAERARHLGASEAAAFATTAGAMLLGLLTGVEASQHRSEHQPQPTEPTLPPSQPADVAPAQPVAADHGPILADEHGTVAQPAPADSATAIHADTAPDAGIAAEAAPDGGSVPLHALVSSIPVWEFNTPADHAHAAADGTGTGGSMAPSSVDSGGLDSGAFIHQLADTITGLVDAPLALVSDTIANLSATVGQLTSSLSGTISQLADGLTGAVTGLFHDTPVAGALEPVLTDILGPAPEQADFAGAAEHGASMLDTAGAVPIAPLHPFPLHLGFLGQATIDGHETHDGAFSALGVHHF
jgi:hypothetical protein